MKKSSQLLVAVLLHIAASSLYAQSFPFLIRVQQPEFISLVSNGASIGVNTPLGTSEDLRVTLVYQGNGQITAALPPELLGSTAFSIVDAPGSGTTLGPNGQYSISLRYTPRRTEAVSSQISLNLVETLTGSNNNTITNPYTFILQLNGTSPSFVVNYVRPDEQNFVPLADGAQLGFPDTFVNETSDVLISVANRGSGPGSISSVLVSGDSFRILGLPILPVSVGVGSELRFTLRFQPRSEGEAAGQLRIVGANRESVNNLRANGYRRTFSYQIIQNGEIRSLQPGQTIDLGEALPSESLSAQLIIQNANPVAVGIPAIALFGSGFGLTELPTANQVLQPGASFSFSLQSLITQVGPQRGRLRIGEDIFDLLATGSGSLLRFSYTSSGSGSVAVAAGGTIFFPTTPIGTTKTAIVTVRNTGISEANVVNISTADSTGLPFSVDSSTLPALPVRIPAGGELSFSINFSPQIAGPMSSQLRIDNTIFNLAAAGTPLPTLPNYSYSLASGTVGPLEQPAIGLRLATPYAVPLNGILTLTSESSTGINDPSVRFSNGASQVAFTIPANTVEAIFPSGNKTIRFQTGSTAGSITLRTTFVTTTGTTIPDPHQTLLQLNVLPQAPRILSFQINSSPTALSLAIAGISTTRSLSKIDIELTPTPGFELSGTRFTVNLEGESLLWFRSAQSQAFGGLFSMSLPLNLALGSNTSGEGLSNLIAAIQRVQITLSNEIGASAPASVNLR